MAAFVPVLNLAPAPGTTPECCRCRRPGVLKITGSLNRNWNAGRPYYKCEDCDQFLVFNDIRGNDPRNPPCHCGASSKAQVSGPEKRVPRGLHYVCRLGTCDFYSTARDFNGNQVRLWQDSLGYNLILLNLI